MTEGNEYPEMAPLDGWHVNLRLSGDNKRADAEALADYLVDPCTRNSNKGLAVMETFDAVPELRGV